MFNSIIYVRVDSIKPRGPESGCSSQVVVERQGRDKQVVEKVRLS